jgi:hypothetical protein
MTKRANIPTLSNLLPAVRKRKADQWDVVLPSVESLPNYDVEVSSKNRKAAESQFAVRIEIQNHTTCVLQQTLTNREVDRQRVFGNGVLRRIICNRGMEKTI